MYHGYKTPTVPQPRTPTYGLFCPPFFSFQESHGMHKHHTERNGNGLTREPPFFALPLSQWREKGGEDHLGKIFISRPPLSPPFPPTVPSPLPTQGNKAEREGSGKGRKVGEEAEKRGGEMAPGKQRQGGIPSGPIFAFLRWIYSHERRERRSLGGRGAKAPSLTIFCSLSSPLFMATNICSGEHGFANEPVFLWKPTKGNFCRNLVKTLLKCKKPYDFFAGPCPQPSLAEVNLPLPHLPKNKPKFGQARTPKKRLGVS